MVNTDRHIPRFLSHYSLHPTYVGQGQAGSNGVALAEFLAVKALRVSSLYVYCRMFRRCSSHRTMSMHLAWEHAAAIDGACGGMVRWVDYFRFTACALSVDSVMVSW